MGRERRLFERKKSKQSIVLDTIAAVFCTVTLLPIELLNRKKKTREKHGTRLTKTRLWAKKSNYRKVYSDMPIHGAVQESLLITLTS